MVALAWRVSLFLFALAVFSPSWAVAALSSKELPQSYCSLGKEIGYPTRPYNNVTVGCASNMVDLTGGPGRNGMRNNLAFYVMGDYDNPRQLMRISLILNVNNEKAKAAGHAEVARVAGRLAVLLDGDEKKKVERMILAGKKGVIKGDSWRTEIKIEKWPTGLGHDVTVYFHPIK